MGAFKLGKMTFGSLFKKPETVKYPFEKKPQPAGLKGHIVIDVENCILCGMCERGCSTNCIKVNKNERFWEIQPYQCVQCGYCITVCPKACLSMDPDYASAAPEMNVTHREVPEQEAKQKAVKQPASEKKAAETKPAPAGKDPETAPDRSRETDSGRDAQVEALLALMDPERAKAAKESLR